MTGPSLAGLWGRRAGAADSFTRYSPALKAADVVWTADTLDPWLTDPRSFVPGSRMNFPGIEDEAIRVDLIAYLETATAGKGDGQGETMGGMSMAPEPQSLATVGPDRQVTAIDYCGDTYRVTTAAGEVTEFWEYNLRFKTDSSPAGPAKGHPALAGAGMMGDRAFVIFADPKEISAFIDVEC